MIKFIKQAKRNWKELNSILLLLGLFLMLISVIAFVGLKILVGVSLLVIGIVYILLGVFDAAAIKS